MSSKVEERKASDAKAKLPVSNFVKTSIGFANGLVEYLTEKNDLPVRTKPVRNELQDRAMSTLLEIGLFMYKKFYTNSKLKPEEKVKPVQAAFTKLKTYVPVTQAVKDGTDAHILRAYGNVYKKLRGLKQLPSNINPFNHRSFKVLTQAQEDKHRDTFIHTIVDTWFRTLSKHYQTIVRGDPKVLFEIGESTNIKNVGATVIKTIGIHALWNRLSQKDQLTVMSMVHNMTAISMAYTDAVKLKEDILPKLRVFETKVREIEVEEGKKEDEASLRIDELSSEMFANMSFIDKMKPGAINNMFERLSKDDAARKKVKKETGKVIDWMMDGGYKVISGNKKERSEAMKEFKKQFSFK